MKRDEFRIAVSTKLQPAQFDRLEKVCGFLGIEKSVFIRNAILDKLQDGAVSDIAGQNILEFNPLENSFNWKIKLDNGQEKDILKDISEEYLRDLSEKINFELNKKNEILGKKQKQSIAVPKRLVR